MSHSIHAEQLSPSASLIAELGIQNSFRVEAKRHPAEKTMIAWTFALLCAVIWASWNQWQLAKNNRDAAFDRMAYTVVDFGSFVPLEKRVVNLIEIDEVFGNQYVKEEKKEPVKDAVESDAPVDPRIAGAVNPFMGNATAPVDLSPEITPEYTPQARNAAIEGTVFLELVISDEGQVLRAVPVGRKLGLGLDEAAAKTFAKKKFRPSINSQGERITVKIIQPVRFELI